MALGALGDLWEDEAGLKWLHSFAATGSAKGICVTSTSKADMPSILSYCAGCKYTNLTGHWASQLQCSVPLRVSTLIKECVLETIGVFTKAELFEALRFDERLGKAEEVSRLVTLSYKL